ncbi:hypothetical protein PanWU01x14_312630, partial [Parasponia andersonii]
MVPVFIFATSFLRLIGEQENIVVASGKISLWCIPFIYYLIFNFTIQMYLQAQLKNMIVGWLSTLAFIFHIIFSWIFVFKLNWGINGALGAMNVASWATVIGQFV